MKILLGFSYYKYPVDVATTVERYVERLRFAGYDVDAYPLTLDPPNEPIWWKQLDRMWKLGDITLLNHYEKLVNRIQEGNYDVFLNFNGINIHPDFVQQIPAFTLYCCNDDPESSGRLSKPVAAAYDLCMIGNIAAIDLYKSWGVKNIFHWPLGFTSNDFDPELTEEQILNGEREYDISLLCERKYHLGRIKRLDQYSTAFPQGNYYGPGWPNGFIEESKKVPIYVNTKIGPNFHNSTGPINVRTYALPACGVMQLCDNKSDLGKLFKLDIEVVGFDTVEEAIEKTKYYLYHDSERRKIAAAGWKRSLKDYNEITVFGLVEKYVNQIIPELKPKELMYSPKKYLEQHRKNTAIRRLGYTIKNFLFKEYYPPE